MESVKAIHLLKAALFACLGFLAWYSVHLSLSRIYQVDECQNIYMARVLATGQESEFFTLRSLFLMGPLSWMAQNATQSADLFASGRLLCLCLFWLNLILLAAIASGNLFSSGGLLALTTAATLAPLWDYGFEIRHDNLVLTSLLFIWWMVRVKPMGLLSYALAGATALAALLLAVKCIVYVLPLSFAILAFPPPAHMRPRWQLALAGVGGALGTTVLIRVWSGSWDAWDVYFSVFRQVAHHSAAAAVGGISRFWPWTTLGRLFGQAPLLLALSVAACFAVAADLVRRRRVALTWDGLLPEFLLLSGALAALMVNPTPFPYNLLHVVPYAFMLAFKYGDALWKELRDRPPFWPFIAAVLVFVHLAPFALASKRHLDRPNSRQKELMRLAEDLTDPAKDPVYDAIGMVPTRRSIHSTWFLHSLILRAVVNVPGSRVRDMLAARPAAVFIPSYRTDWLPPEDHDFIRERYVPLADDFWVLGTVLPAGGGTFEIVHPGRYRIVRLNPSDVGASSPKDAIEPLTWEESGSITGTLDGTVLTNHPVELGLGLHRLETTNDCQPAVVWVGPSLDDVPRIGPGNHHTLFWNWY